MLPNLPQPTHLKFCKYCQTNQPETSFEVCQIIKGVAYRRLRCKKCKRAIRIQRIARLKLWLTTYKKTLHCKRCGFSDYRALQFHHRGRSAKDFNVADMAKQGSSIAAIEREIAKCIVLCANCHQIEHYKRSWKRGRESIRQIV